MLNSIISKLSNELKGEINKEDQVLYVMAEARKFIEAYEPGNTEKYSTLYFYADWVLHIKMDRNPTKKLLSTFDEYFKQYETTEHSDADITFLTEQASFFFLYKLKDEIQIFCESQDLPNFLKDKQNWRLFRRLLLEILIDCPLENKEGFVKRFSYVKNILDHPEVIYFEVKYGNGRSRTFSVDDIDAEWPKQQT
jgi:hypothetical protein